MKLYKFCWLFN